MWMKRQSGNGCAASGEYPVSTHSRKFLLVFSMHSELSVSYDNGQNTNTGTCVRAMPEE